MEPRSSGSHLHFLLRCTQHTHTHTHSSSIGVVHTKCSDTLASALCTWPIRYTHTKHTSSHQRSNASTNDSALGANDVIASIFPYSRNQIKFFFYASINIEHFSVFNRTPTCDVGRIKMNILNFETNQMSQWGGGSKRHNENRNWRRTFDASSQLRKSLEKQKLKIYLGQCRFTSIASLVPCKL